MIALKKELKPTLVGVGHAHAILIDRSTREVKNECPDNSTQKKTNLISAPIVELLPGTN